MNFLVGRRTREGKSSFSDIGLGRLLVRVGSVTEGELLSALGEDGLLVGRCGGDGVGGRVLPAEVVGDSRVVCCSVGEGLRFRY